MHYASIMKKINGPIQGLTYRNSLSPILSNVNKYICLALLVVVIFFVKVYSISVLQCLTMDDQDKYLHILHVSLYLCDLCCNVIILLMMIELCVKKRLLVSIMTEQRLGYLYEDFMSP